jgi:3-isopropylmalate/(R)-2-methylmalate dehydratase small subunit
MISGRVWKFGDDINTDVILPTAVMYQPATKQALQVFASLRPEWAENEARPGDLVLAGRNFGLGSSRPAQLGLKALGVGCLIADSINPLFFRNCVSFGLMAIECAGVSAAFAEGDIAEVDLTKGTIRNPRTQQVMTGVPVPEALLSLMQGGGIFPLLESEGLLGPASDAAAESAG